MEVVEENTYAMRVTWIPEGIHKVENGTMTVETYWQPMVWDEFNGLTVPLNPSILDAAIAQSSSQTDIPINLPSDVPFILDPEHGDYVTVTYSPGFERGDDMIVYHHMSYRDVEELNPDSTDSTVATRPPRNLETSLIPTPVSSDAGNAGGLFSFEMGGEISFE